VACLTGNASSAQPLTISSYTAAALAAAPEVQQAESAYKVSDAAYKGTVANMALPTVSFSATAYPYGDNPQNNYQFNTWRLNRSDMSFNTTVNYNLFNSGQDAQKVRAAFAGREAALRAWRAAMQDRAFAAVNAFYELDGKNELLTVAQENLKAQQAQYEQSQDLYQNGMKSLADLLKSETDWRSSQLRLISAQADQHQALVAFNTLIDREALREADLSVDLSTRTLVEKPSVSADTARARAQRPEVVRARKQYEQARIAFQQSVQGFLPIFKVDATWNRTDTANFGTPVSASSLGIPQPNYYLGLSLSLPFGYNGFSQAYAMIQAKAQRQSALQNVAAVERAVRQEVAGAYITLDKAIQSYAVAQLKEDIAKRALDLVTNQYAQGSADAIRMNQAQNDFLDARVSRALALHDIFIERARYTRAVGDPLYP
jgi:outer membrane protein TolC